MQLENHRLPYVLFIVCWQHKAAQTAENKLQTEAAVCSALEQFTDEDVFKTSLLCVLLTSALRVGGVVTLLVASVSIVSRVGMLGVGNELALI